jgi:hypothetical protein
MKNKVGAPPKIKGEKKVIRVSRVVPLENFEEIQRRINDIINNAQKNALDKCVEEALKNR